ncbi:hypothetical protein CDAR_109741 [Caerostris darwini]|uniref:Uncharacterized protein n=1 Tax=Caerostris darwini TaxID=1538125 RepID=A0AAV4SVP9_9ARAC|nr:hypothetical protein CDAR_109741 [Caerostris darwini]
MRSRPKLNSPFPSKSFPFLFVRKYLTCETSGELTTLFFSRGFCLLVGGSTLAIGGYQGETDPIRLYSAADRGRINPNTWKTLIFRETEPSVGSFSALTVTIVTDLRYWIQ